MRNRRARWTLRAMHGDAPGTILAGKYELLEKAGRDPELETLAGRELFEAPSDMEVIFLVQEANVPDLSDVRPDVPDALCEVLGTALARDPSAPFGTAHRMARTLAELLRTTDEPTDSRRIAALVGSARERMGLAADRAEASTVVLDDVDSMIED